jgi:ubiquitin-protein ligase
MAELEYYTFKVVSEVDGHREIEVQCDPNDPLMEIWAHVARQEGFSLSTYDAEGNEIEIEWSYSWGSGSTVEPLAEHRSLREAAVPAESVIQVRGRTIGGSPMITPHVRLRGDRRKLIEFVDRNKEHISIHDAQPEAWLIRFHGIRAIVGLDEKGHPMWGEEHEAQLTFNPDEYPFYPPGLKPLSPVFHPNVSPESYCLFEQFPLEAPDPLSLMLSQAVEILQYREFNLKEPHNKMNPEASEWVKNKRHEEFMPIEPMVRLL